MSTRVFCDECGQLFHDEDEKITIGFSTDKKFDACFLHFHRGCMRRVVEFFESLPNTTVETRERLSRFLPKED